MERSTKIKLIITAASIVIEAVLSVIAYCLYGVIDRLPKLVGIVYMQSDKLYFAASGSIAVMVFIVVLNVIIWLSDRIFED